MGFHSCLGNREFVGIGYDYYQPSIDSRTSGFAYGVMTFELYRCSVCGRIKYKNTVYFQAVTQELMDKRVESLEKIGYKPIGELSYPDVLIDKAPPKTNKPAAKA